MEAGGRGGRGGQLNDSLADSIRQRISYYSSVVDNGTHVLLYYDAHGPLPAWAGRATCLAVSASGRGGSFERPALGLSLFNGSRRNNIVWPTDNRGDSSVPGCNDRPGLGCREWWSPGAAFIDNSAPASERYKMVGGWCPKDAAHPCLGTWVFSSSDGLHYKNVSAKPIYHGSDTEDVLLFDDKISKYVAFRRLHLRGAGTHKYDRDRYGRACERCRPATPGYPALNMSGEACGYSCPAGSRGEPCGGCTHLKPVPCHFDADCVHVRRWTALTLCQSPAAAGNICAKLKIGAKICAAPTTVEPLCVGSGQCGLGYAAERYVGRCESETLDGFSCDEGGAVPVEIAAGPDKLDSSCVDVYQSNVVVYNSHYLSFPAFYEHTALPPAWGQFDKGTDAWAEGDGFVDSRMMHSRDGHDFKYIAGDRTPFFGRGPSFAPPAASHVRTPSASNPRSWRQSMAGMVRGYVLRDGRIYMYGVGTRARHNQDDSTEAQGGGGQITRLSLRIDGFASVSASSAGTDGEFTTKPLVLSHNHSELFLNSIVSDGGCIDVELSECHDTMDSSPPCAPVSGYGLDECVVQAGDTVYSRPVFWAGNRSASSLVAFQGRTIQLRFRLRQPATLFGFRFKADDNSPAHGSSTLPALPALPATTSLT